MGITGRSLTMPKIGKESEKTTERYLAERMKALGGRAVKFV